MRTLWAAALVLLLGALSLPALAGKASQSEARMSCAVLAGQTTLPTGLCQHLAKAILLPRGHVGLSDFLAENPAMPVLMRRPLTAHSPMVPARPLKTNAGWQAHLDKGVANFHQIFNGQNLTIPLTAAPSVLWPGGNPFTPAPAD